MSDEDIKKLAVALKDGDKDSFSSFRAGLKDNWLFLGAIVMGVMWVFNSFGTVDAKNVQQDAKLEALTLSVTQLTANVVALTAKTDTDNQSRYQMQQDIALIKADVNTIKERTPGE